MEKRTRSLDVACFGWAQFEAMGRPGCMGIINLTCLGLISKTTNYGG